MMNNAASGEKSTGTLSQRTAPMHEDGGISYIYFIYGMYYCFNVVARAAGHPEAVLIRALRPIDGLAKSWHRLR